ncbi:hypothetical protein ACA910_015210 [Epithemia clementina (nom. ined.)]
MTNKPAKKPKVKNGEPPPIDKLLKPAIGVALALVAYQFIRGLGGIKRVNIADEAELRDVFFGEGGTGKSYAVLCQSEESTSPVSSVFQEACKDGTASKLVEFRLLDCSYILPTSEKSVADRFGLDLTKRPTIFLSGAVGSPQQIDERFLKTGPMFVKFIRGKLEGRAAKIETTADLKTKCLDKNFCGLLLKGSKKPPSHIKDAMTKLLKDFPDIAFASIDSSVLYLLNLEDMLPELENEMSRFVMFKKVSGSLEPGGSRLITSYATIPNAASVRYEYMNNLVSSIAQGTEQATKLPSLPVVKTRSKKLVESEKAKRQRRLDQQRRKEERAQGGGSSSSSDDVDGDASDNDGTREGRRAERERRRQEHAEKHNIKPKTPEEIAEMERRRRARMEEEAAKWNVAPDDAPDEGDPLLYEDVDQEIMENADDEVIEDADAHEDADDEDVIDLD